MVVLHPGEGVQVNILFMLKMGEYTGRIALMGSQSVMKRYRYGVKEGHGDCEHLLSSFPPQNRTNHHHHSVPWGVVWRLLPSSVQVMHTYGKLTHASTWIFSQLFVVRLFIRGIGHFHIEKQKRGRDVFMYKTVDIHSTCASQPVKWRTFEIRHPKSG